jgi:hypothetical protein
VVLLCCTRHRLITHTAGDLYGRAFLQKVLFELGASLETSRAILRARRARYAFLKFREACIHVLLVLLITVGLLTDHTFKLLLFKQLSQNSVELHGFLRKL